MDFGNNSYTYWCIVPNSDWNIWLINIQNEVGGKELKIIRLTKTWVSLNI